MTTLHDNQITKCAPRFQRCEALVRSRGIFSVRPRYSPARGVCCVNQVDSGCSGVAGIKSRRNAVVGRSLPFGVWPNPCISTLHSVRGCRTTVRLRDGLGHGSYRIGRETARVAGSSLHQLSSRRSGNSYDSVPLQGNACKTWRSGLFHAACSSPVEHRGRPSNEGPEVVGSIPARRN